MEKLKNFFDKKAICTFYASVVMMIITHGFCFMNIMYSHDSLGFFDTKGIGKVGLGRWMYPFLVQRRLVATPWLMGGLSILYVSLAVVLVMKLFNFNKVQGFCVSILFTSNITLTSLFCTYIFDADADCMALLLACFAVYASKHFPKILNVIVPIISLVLCLALYQAYVCVAIGLYLILLIYESEEVCDWRGVLELFLLAIKELVILVLATVIYIPLMHVVAKYYGVELSNSYNGAGQLSSLTLKDILDAIPKTYEYFKDYFLCVTGYNSVTMVGINRIMIILLIISIALYALEHRKFLGSFVVVIPCILLMPLALNAIYLVSMGTIHKLMVFAFNIAFLLPIVFIEMASEIQMKYTILNKIINCIRMSVFSITVIAIMIIGFKNVIYSNGAYVHKKLVYDNTALHAQTIWKDINSIEEYIEGKTQVVFMGYFESSKVGYHSSVGSEYDGVLTGTVNSAITYDGKAWDFYYGILGREMNFAYNDTDISKNEEYMKMPVYPQNGYCKMIGDRVVVRMSE